MRLKYEGESYDTISKKTGVPKNTILGWFEREGLLYEPYREFADAINGEVVKKMQDQFSSAGETSAKMIIGLMASKSDGIKLKAATIIKETLMGKPVQPIADENDKSLLDLPYELRLKKLREEYGNKQADKNKPGK